MSQSLGVQARAEWSPSESTQKRLSEQCKHTGSGLNFSFPEKVPSPLSCGVSVFKQRRKGQYLALGRGYLFVCLFCKASHFVEMISNLWFVNTSLFQWSIWICIGYILIPFLCPPTPPLFSPPYQPNSFSLPHPLPPSSCILPSHTLCATRFMLNISFS